MTDLVESSTFEEGIYQLETTDPVQGGLEGISNLQPKQLANRTRWLKDQVDELNGLRGKAAPAFSVANSYTAGELVSHQKNLWRANTSISPGTFNPANWTKVLGSAAEQDAVTAPQFDNDTSLATTEFVQRALGNDAGVVIVTANRTMTAADAGKYLFSNANSLVYTLPDPATLPLGAKFRIAQGNLTSGGSIAAPGATTIGNISDGGTVSSISMQQSTEYDFTVVSSSAYQVSIIRGPSIGVNQTVQQFTSPSRLPNTDYVNTTGQTIFVCVNTSLSGSASLQMRVDGLQVDFGSNPEPGVSGSFSVSWPVPSGSTYRIERTGTANTLFWFELRKP